MNDIAHFNEILDNILIPRVVGTANHKKVREYIAKELKNLKWTIEFDEFDDKTPNMGTLTFTNIIAKLNPNAERYLVLACHYDSKYFPDQEFLGESNCDFEFKFLTDF
jgi:glutaminyl-peptide cyclotransferase